MSETCNHDCSSCSQSCESRDPKSFLEKPHEKSTIRKVIGVVSGKSAIENIAQNIVQEVAERFLMGRASSDVASSWLDIGQFWGNLAKSLTDAVEKSAPRLAERR